MPQINYQKAHMIHWDRIPIYIYIYISFIHIYADKRIVVTNQSNMHSEIDLKLSFLSSRNKKKLQKLRQMHFKPRESCCAHTCSCFTYLTNIKLRILYACDHPTNNQSCKEKCMPFNHLCYGIFLLLTAIIACEHFTPRWLFTICRW